MKLTVFSAILITTFVGSEIVIAQGSTPTPEQRQGMAKNLENMAACLRSSKPIEDCHNEMRKACDMQSGDHGCFMMDGMHGRKRGVKAKESSESKTPKNDFRRNNGCIHGSTVSMSALLEVSGSCCARENLSMRL